MRLTIAPRMGQGFFVPQWVIVGTSITGSPTVAVPATPSISSGILSGPFGVYRIVNATLGTDVEQTLTPPVSLSSFSTPGDSLTIYYLRFSSQSPQVTMPAPGFTATETWSAYANGNTFTELDALYDRGSTAFVPTIVTEAPGPAGLACQYGVSGSTPYAMTKTAITTELSGRIASQKVQVLAQMKLGASNCRGGIGYLNGSTHSGIAIRRNSTNDIWIQTEGDLGTLTNTTALASGMADGSVIWLKYEVEGAVIRAKYWLDGGSEPGSWTSRTHSGDVPFASLGLIGRLTASAYKCLGYSIGITVDAPTF